MAKLDTPTLIFDEGCPDPGRREVRLPSRLPIAGDDFDWSTRDFDGFREAMLEALMLRFPERKRWTPADLEVVFIETFSAVLDQLSDMADRVAGESYLETARLPSSVYQWLDFIGVHLTGLYKGKETKQAVLDHWEAHPHEMEKARWTGPGTIHHQKRMASLDDFGVLLEKHPLVRRAHAERRYTGSWSLVWILLSLFDDHRLDDSLEKASLPPAVVDEIEMFHRRCDLFPPEWSNRRTLRDMLELYIGQYRMLGQDVTMADVTPVGIDIALCLRLGGNYFHSEVRREATALLGRGAGGFFEPGRLRFGESLHASDLFERMMQMDGVLNMQLLTFKRVGDIYPNQVKDGRIALLPMEIAVCDNTPERRARGLLTIQLEGGRRG